MSRYGSLNFRPVPTWLEAPRVYRGVAPSLRGIDFNSLSIFHNLGDPPAELNARFSNGVAIQAFIGPDAEIYAVIREPDGSIISTKSRAIDVPIPELSILPQVGPLLREEFILDSEYARRITASNWSSIHFRNQLYLYPQYFDDFKALSESTWPGLRIMSLEHDNELTRKRLALLVQDNDFVAEVAWMGHGLQIWLQTMWFLARSKGSQSVILDEPDVYMHADLQRKLIRLLLKRHPQVIAATHSVEIMSEVEASDILIINRTQPESKFADSIPAVQKVIDLIGGVHNLQLARLWNSRKCVSVEGKDVTFLRHIQSVLFPTSAEPLDTLPNIRLGGWSNWGYAIGSKLLLRNAFDDDVAVYCVLDSDYHLPEEIDGRYAQAKTSGVELHIWKRKEIENYFVVPEAIRRVIIREKRVLKDDPTPEEIQLS